ncbi:MAG: hypothetical protein U0R24_06770 [Solirubrobacterales bacterium]
MANLDNLPDSRQSLLGYDYDGDEVWLIRGISQKQYTCPGCYGDVEIGEDHVIAQTIHRLGGTEHRHWHRSCALRSLAPGLRRLKAVDAREAGRDKLDRRGKRPAGKRGRRAPRRR